MGIYEMIHPLQRKNALHYFGDYFSKYQLNSINATYNSNVERFNEKVRNPIRMMNMILAITSIKFISINAATELPVVPVNAAFLGRNGSNSTDFL